eukprot:766407-Hanusia_phi.AAC.12
MACSAWQGPQTVQKPRRDPARRGARRAAFDRGAREHFEFRAATGQSKAPWPLRRHAIERERRGQQDRSRRSEEERRQRVEERRRGITGRGKTRTP